MTVTGSITITDLNGVQHTLSSNDLDFQEVERTSRSMGDEIMYSAEVEGNGWSAQIDVLEYPIGDHSHDDISVENGTYEGNFNYTF